MTCAPAPERTSAPEPGIFDHLEPVFANAQIDTRYACQPFAWYPRAARLRREDRALHRARGGAGS
ncbi:MAG: hypothetical protein WDM84_04950 [Bauldia sp.]